MGEINVAKNKLNVWGGCFQLWRLCTAVSSHHPQLTTLFTHSKYTTCGNN